MAQKEFVPVYLWNKLTYLAIPTHEKLEQKLEQKVVTY